MWLSFFSFLFFYLFGRFTSEFGFEDGNVVEISNRDIKTKKRKELESGVRSTGAIKYKRYERPLIPFGYRDIW